MLHNKKEFGIKLYACDAVYQFNLTIFFCHLRINTKLGGFVPCKKLCLVCFVTCAYRDTPKRLA